MPWYVVLAGAVLAVCVGLLVAMILAEARK
jgi:hypothetical protein